ncbi:MAG: AAA family ATPase [Acidimicrobiia bacterium]|nr:AAA family ATPase [Acidimicrobiia bacterium]
MTLTVVTGTGTEVGKTWFGAATLRAAAAAGAGVAARKPVESFAPGEGQTDSEALASVTGEDPLRVCPAHRRFPVAMAPPMAAAALGLPAFTIAELAGEVRAHLPGPAGASGGLLVLVEGAGGPRSPLADDGDTVDLAGALRPDAVVLVADAGLGTINAVRLCAGALADHRLIVALNRFDPPTTCITSTSHGSATARACRW